MRDLLFDSSPVLRGRGQAGFRACDRRRGYKSPIRWILALLARAPAVPLEPDGWLEVPVEDRPRGGEALGVRATDAYGHSIFRTVRLGPETIEVD
jgi:hypothetical protein